jgi:hypothetical protein
MKKGSQESKGISHMFWVLRQEFYKFKELFYKWQGS